VQTLPQVVGPNRERRGSRLPCRLLPAFLPACFFAMISL
jgi:hypothetical protein